MGKTIFIAHRGAWLPGRRENSVKAISRAAESGRFSYIEMDVRRTRSNDEVTQTPIIIHDETLDRLYEQNRVPKSKRRRLGQSVYGLTIDIIRSEEVEVATLAEALRAAQGHPVILDIKSRKAVDPTLEVLHDIIQKYAEWSWEKIVITSFDWDILYECKQKAPSVGLAMLYGIKQFPRSFGRHYHVLDARWISFNKWIAPIGSLLAIAFKVSNRHVYTINKPSTVRWMRLLGIKGIITDAITMPDMFKD